jgi:hypothetical protein
MKRCKMQKSNHNFNLLENLEMGDLKRLVHPELHIDEYKSKMGEDSDVCVLSFKVSGKEPSSDLVNFIEKGYGYVLDADVSSGEKEGGDYLVFIELDRTPELPIQIIEIMEDVMNLSGQDLSDWRVRYRKSTVDYNATEEDLKKIIPLTPDEYNKKYEREQEEIDSLKTAAGVEVTTKAPKNEFTESLRIAAGLR